MGTSMKRVKLLTAVFTLAAGVAFAQSGAVQAPTGPGGTWNVYQLNPTGQGWSDAHAFAATQLDPVSSTLPGHLVTLTTPVENSFIVKWINGGNSWMGLSDRVGVAPGATESSVTVDPVNMGWAWITGEPFTWQNWNTGSGEPNDWPPGEDAGQLTGSGLWNDHKTGYGVDLPVPDINSTDETGSPNYKSTIEWETNSPTPLAGIREGNVFADLSSTTLLPGPMGYAGHWGIREIKLAGGGPGNVYDAIDVARAGGGTELTSSFATLDTTDPDTSTTPNGSVPGYKQAFLSDTPGVDDNDIVTVAHGTMNITTAGDYTFQMRSDDGFAMRIPGHDLVAVHGPNANAGIDPLDPEVAFYRNGTGDANTRMVYNLPVGTHVVEMMHWEGGGGAYYELSSAMGNITDANLANWILVGDTATSTAPQTFADPVVMTGDATSYKVDSDSATTGTVPGALAATISQTDAAVAGGTADWTATHDNIDITGAHLDGTDDDYLLRVDGQFIIDNGVGSGSEALAVTFALRNDDGGGFHIIGQDFTAVAGNAQTQLWDFSGDDGIGSDFLTGDTQGLGHITLTEGVAYDFSAYHFERGGGDRLWVSMALGTWTGVGDAGAEWWTLDTNDETFTRAANSGIGLVDAIPEPGTALLLVLGLTALMFRRKN